MIDINNLKDTRPNKKTFYLARTSEFKYEIIALGTTPKRAWEGLKAKYLEGMTPEEIKNELWDVGMDDIDEYLEIWGAAYITEVIVDEMEVAE